MNVFKQVILKVKTSLFIQNVAALATGTTFAQIVSIVTAPILYRIYDKEDYGTIGLYLALVGVVSVFSTMQYNHAILLEKEDENAKVVMWLNRIVNTIVALISLIIVIFFDDSIGIMLGNEKITKWLFLFPISIFFIGQGQILSVWANRKKKYRVLTFNSIFTSLSVPIVSISIGIFNNGPFGLFMGLLVSHTLPSIILLILLTRQDDLGLNYLKFYQIKIFIKRYKKFAILSLPTEFMGTLTKQLPVYFLTYFSGPSAVGLYGLAIKMISIPIQFVGGAISKVFRQRASEDFNKEGHFQSIYLKTLKSLFLVSIPMVVIVIIFGKKIFSFVFGEEWADSGTIAQIMIIMFALRLISSPLSYTYFIREKLLEDFIINFYVLISSSLIFYFGFQSKQDYFFVLLLFSLNYAVVYIFYIYRSYRFASK
jgi:O-antigen/teichoic acid export membrane protein